MNGFWRGTFLHHRSYYSQRLVAWNSVWHVPWDAGHDQLLQEGQSGAKVVPTSYSPTTTSMCGQLESCTREAFAPQYYLHGDGLEFPRSGHELLEDTKLADTENDLLVDRAKYPPRVDTNSVSSTIAKLTTVREQCARTPSLYQHDSNLD